MKQVILHVGFHKTATSSIQSTCADNQDFLLSKGLFYPIFQGNNIKINNHSIPLYSLFTETPEDYHINMKWGVSAKEINQEYLAQLDEIIQRPETLIISGEDISVLPEKSLTKLKQYFEDNDRTIKVIAFIRSSLSYEISAAQEVTKNGNTLSFTSLQLISKKIQTLQAVFADNIDFYSFQKACSHNNGPVGLFLELIGLSSDDISGMSLQHINESMSAQATRIISYINEKEPLYIKDKNSRKPEKNPNRSRGDTRVFQKIGGNKFKPSLSEVTPILKKTNNENEWLKQNFGEEYCDKDMEFNNPVFTWDSKNLMELEHALLNCTEIVRNLVFEFLENEQYSNELDKAVLKYISDKTKAAIKTGERKFSDDEIVDALRDAAIAMEKTDLKKSYILMSLAHRKRQTGTLILEKLNEYERKLKM